MDNQIYFRLLSEWCEGLLSLQLCGTGNPTLDGAILCPACKHIHGRCDNAIYPFMTMADRTGDVKWLNAAKALFDWHENMLCDDGSVYNDANSTWGGITVFSATGLCEALHRHGHLLDLETKTRWEARLRRMGEWLYRVIDEHYHTNINYCNTNACALAMLGVYFDLPEYRAQAKHLADFALAHFTENGMLYGEGYPFDVRTEKGCRPIDIGYNVEESVPSLVKYALTLGDREALDRLRTILTRQLALFLPDGAWDNSFGTRNNKWTYWGSRTSDGCQGAYGLLAKTDPVFNTVSWLNTKLLDSCTHPIPGKDTRLLYGGPQYYEAGEPPCCHHSFCHANSLAAALDNGIEDAAVFAPLPAPEGLQYFPELDVYKASAGGFRATMTGYDWDVKEGHLSGGTLSLLWHEKTGPILLASVLHYQMVEPLNMQLPLLKERHRPLAPRAELFFEGRRHTNAFDVNAGLSASETGEGVLLRAEAVLAEEPAVPPHRNNRGYLPPRPMSPAVHLSLTYDIRPEGVTISGQFRGGDWTNACFVLPVIAENVKVEPSREASEPKDIFFLTGGFTAKEHILLPDENGCFSVRLTVGSPGTV